MCAQSASTESKALAFVGFEAVRGSSSATQPGEAAPEEDPKWRTVQGRFYLNVKKNVGL